MLGLTITKSMGLFELWKWVCHSCTWQLSNRHQPMYWKIKEGYILAVCPLQSLKHAKDSCCQLPYCTGLLLGLHPANERQCYFVTMSLTGWSQNLESALLCHRYGNNCKRFINSASSNVWFQHTYILAPREQSHTSARAGSKELPMISYWSMIKVTKNYYNKRVN